MIEIIISIILQITTILGGGDASKDALQASETKAKAEQTSQPEKPEASVDGGTGQWND
ncbi:hypothetical protein H7F15_13060 [Pontibacter sp. Tf4]|uniref:hypothetical protein n=1 Tax=Pontibacter sp. Tf4 TaxID=2761620 RepID=UPI001626AECC|nr:hypothetical protein [Pontibacter sp. Tf4]MBB6611973.1 hypothetical protein [Pontibacter sp. Tf4]